MIPPSIKMVIPNIYKRFLYLTFSICWLTGLIFFILNEWVTINGDFGPEKHPLQFPVLQAHGAVAFLLIMLYGALVTNHATSGWKSGRSRALGLSLVVSIGVQIVLGYLLYYIANEKARAVVGYTHLGIGLILPLLLYVHIIKVKQSKLS